MKYSLAFSAIAASAFAATIPADAHHHIQRRAADPQPVCSFENHTFKEDSSAWDSISPATSKRDLKVKTWNPPSNIAAALDSVWDHEMKTYSNPLGFKNYGYDQVLAAKGKINYCVRWEGNAKVTEAQRTKVEVAIRRAFNKWMAVLAGFEGWPYATVDVNVVGWAVNDASILQGDVSKIDVYTDKDDGGVPQCAESCGRFFNQDGNYAGCAKGAARHYDQSIWLTPGLGGGAGGDWGQRVAQEYFMENLDLENLHIVLHELGHTFALDDFYDWTPAGVTNFVMNAGSATEITEFDAWMARDWWRHLKTQRGW
ncbi:uncharacterized protein K460DRAFT_414198 [Cucurbitaria berberidis CBS 394.84]|uniref:Uncharacterized protein n=1 Tax=Cucurbitaria berberidis CBS 394.84 TaxID=1168544 RepID=A0A9P4GLJ5_9PLEO|nr:uncharacterized protein K460DRAFT_414198 [Cucurbitaria berberidis CBS 394.84]KAF1847452.1 hypothetical protein K460DRAFT_414198 [Cucurbitaria berberidis CBS 394.84]